MINKKIKRRKKNKALILDFFVAALVTYKI